MTNTTNTNVTNDQDAPGVVCPACGKGTPAVSNRSDDKVSYRCDACGHRWTCDVHGRPDAEGTDDVPPVPAIDAPGG